MKKYLVFASLIIFVFLVGCTASQEPTNTQPPANEQTNGQHSTAPPNQPQQFTEAIKDSGFKVVYKPSTNLDFMELEKAFKEAHLFEDIAKDLNDDLALPKDVPVVLGECGEVNAYYDPESKSIYMCYELVQDISEIFANIAKSDEELDKAVVDTTSFIFYHEMGHALVDILDLPTTGKEEDAVDGLSTLVLTRAGEEGEDAAINGAVWFFKRGEKSKVSKLALADEHALDEQRYYNVLCWIYGKNPERNSYLVEEEYLPEERAGGCASEYAQIESSWGRLLSPYYKTNS